MMDINTYLKRVKEIKEIGGYEYLELAPRVQCVDGFNMSVQASRLHYCTPRDNDASRYEAVEIGYPNMLEADILEYAKNPDSPTETVYGYVPVEIVDAVIIKHGGIINI